MCRVVLIAVCCAWSFAFQTQVSLAQPAEKNGLPPTFRPPPPTPKEFSIENQLIQADEVDEWRKKERVLFQEALSRGKLVGPDLQLADKGFRAQVHELSIPEKRADLTDLRKAITRNIDQFVPEKAEDAKKIACKLVVKHASDLLDGNFHVRCQAVQLIGELNLSPEVPGLRPKPAVTYIDGLSVLLEVIHPKKGGIQQPEPVRILAALGAKRLLSLGHHTLKPNSKLPVEAARAILAELEGQGSDWYHLRLVEALIETRLSTVPNAQNRQEPVIVEALARIMTNPRRSLRIRARSVYLLGRTPMPGAIQSAPIAYSTVKLTQQIATLVNQKRLNGLQALFMLQDIYLGFKPEPGESTTDGRKLAGLISTLPQQPIQSAYKDILPIVRSILRQFQGAPAGAQQINVTFVPGLIQKLSAWQKPPSMALSQGRVEIDQPLRKPAPQTDRAARPTANRPSNGANRG